PVYARVGMLAPLLLLLLRVVQGIAVGGEVPGAWVFVAEHVPPQRIGVACAGAGLRLEAAVPDRRRVRFFRGVVARLAARDAGVRGDACAQGTGSRAAAARGVRTASAERTAVDAGDLDADGGDRGGDPDDAVAGAVGIPYRAGAGLSREQPGVVRAGGGLPVLWLAGGPAGLRADLVAGCARP